MNILKYQDGKYNEKFCRIQRNLYAANSIHNNNISDLIEDKYHDGLLWVGTPLAGLSKMYKRSKKFETNHLKSPAIPNHINPVVRNIRRTKDGKLWVGTDQGLILYDPLEKKYEILSKINLKGEKERKEHLPTGYISSFYEDKTGRLWGTSRIGLF